MLLPVLIALGMLFCLYHWVKAGSNCVATYVNGQVQCLITGADNGTANNNGNNNNGNNGNNKSGNNGNNNSNAGSGNANACVANGNETTRNIFVPLNFTKQGKPQCQFSSVQFNSCGDPMETTIENPTLGQGPQNAQDCPGSKSTPAPQSNNTNTNKCSLDYNGGTISCSWNFQWKLVASVSMPPIVIDTRPYPVTLVNWPTTMRVNSLTTNSGSGTLAYAGWGGGEPGNSRPGDWKNITLTLTFRPTGNPVTVTLAQQPAFTVSASRGGTKTFTWTVASHPAVGAVKTAGEVGQLGEIPGDMTLFQGNSMTTYRLFYALTYQEYSTHTECRDSATPVPAVPPAIPPGAYQCKNVVTVGEWNGKSENGEILPGEVQNLPASINGGSVYNDYSVVIRRMNDSGSTSDPAYAHQYSWGSIYYWACREGEGQEGWPSQ
jgi:hypothetical protein